MRESKAPWMILAMAALLATGADDMARDAPPPPSPAFAPPGRGVLFADDFSGDLSAWSADTPDVWRIVRGMLRADLPDRRQARSLLYAGDVRWEDYALDLDVCAMRGVDKGPVVRAQGDVGIGIDLRGGAYQDVVAYVREWPAGKAPAVNAGTVWNHLRVEVQGVRLRVWVNGQLAIDRRQTRAARGRIALSAYTGGSGECTVYYDNVIVTAL